MALPTLVLLAVSVLRILYRLELPRVLRGILYHDKPPPKCPWRSSQIDRPRQENFTPFSLRCVDLSSPVIQALIKPLGPPL